MNKDKQIAEFLVFKRARILLCWTTLSDQPLAGSLLGSHRKSLLGYQTKWVQSGTGAFFKTKVLPSHSCIMYVRVARVGV